MKTPALEALVQRFPAGRILTGIDASENIEHLLATCGWRMVEIHDTDIARRFAGIIYLCGNHGMLDRMRLGPIPG